MSSFQQVNSIINGAQPLSALDANTTWTIVNSTVAATSTTMYSTYAIVNATIDAYTADTTNLFDGSTDDALKRLNNASNDTDDGIQKRDHVFDRTDVRVIFIIIYSLVFCCCFFGEYICIKKINSDDLNVCYAHTLDFI